MKKSKIFILLMCVMASFALTSCLDDDDDDYKELTAAEKAQAYSTIRGTYQGKLVCRWMRSGASEVQEDSTDISWYFESDSTFIVSNVPVSYLSKCVTDNVIKTALEEQGTVDLKCHYDFFQLSPIAFLINPETVSFDLSYNGAVHKVSLVFMVNYGYSTGYYDANYLKLYSQFFVGALYEDNNLMQSFSPSILLGLKGKRA